MKNPSNQTTRGKQKNKRRRSKKALKRAEEIRRFEIDLYWRRTTYCWTLIAAAFVAFFAILSAKGLDGSAKLLMAFVVANVGFVFSVGWYFINRGSKFWQQSWEIQVDLMEKELGIELYRSVPKKTKRGCFLVAPGRYSVSKINQLTSLYIALIWFMFGVYVFTQIKWECLCSDSFDEYCICAASLLALITVITCVLFYGMGRTEVKDEDHCYYYSKVKRTPIEDKTQ